MATSSIKKDFYAKNQEAFMLLKKELEEKTVSRKVVESPALKRGKEKLATFVFTSKYSTLELGEYNEQR